MYIYIYSVYYEITITTLRQTQALPTFQSKDLKFPVVSGAPNSNSVLTSTLYSHESVKCGDRIYIT